MGKRKGKRDGVGFRKSKPKTQKYVVGIGVEAKNSVHAARIVDQRLSTGEVYVVFTPDNMVEVVDLKEEDYKGRRHDNGDL